MNGLDFTYRAQLIRDQLQDALSASVAPIRPGGQQVLPRSLFGQQQPQAPLAQAQAQPQPPGVAQNPPMAQQPPQVPSGALQAATPPHPAGQGAAPVQQPLQRFASGGGAWTRKEGKNPEGGLNAKGRASLRAQGHDIKPPVSAKQAKKSPKAAARRKSFCARSAGQAKMFPQAAKNPNSRLNKARRKWEC